MHISSAAFTILLLLTHLSHRFYINFRTGYDILILHRIQDDGWRCFITNEIMKTFWEITSLAVSWIPGTPVSFYIHRRYIFIGKKGLVQIHRYNTYIIPTIISNFEPGHLYKSTRLKIRDFKYTGKRLSFLSTEYMLPDRTTRYNNQYGQYYSVPVTKQVSWHQTPGTRY